MKTFVVDDKAVRKRMIDMGVKSINELAAKAGVSKPTIYEYFNGRPPMSAAFLRLCAYLEMDPGSLLNEIEIEIENPEDVEDVPASDKMERE